MDTSHVGLRQKTFIIIIITVVLLLYLLLLCPQWWHKRCYHIVADDAGVQIKIHLKFQTPLETQEKRINIYKM